MDHLLSDLPEVSCRLPASRFANSKVFSGIKVPQRNSGGKWEKQSGVWSLESGGFQYLREEKTRWQELYSLK